MNRLPFIFRRTLKRLIGRWAGPALLFALRLTKKRAGLVLLYHRIDVREGDPRRELVPPLHVDRFSQQVRYLRRHYQIVRHDELTDAVACRRRGSRFPVVLTFDDDSPQHATHALRVLTDAHVPATFFLCGSFLDQRADSYWWQRLQRAIDAGLSVTGAQELLPVAGRDRQSTPPRDVHELAKAVARVSPVEREAFSERLLHLAGPDDSRELLTREDAAKLIDSGFSIGFHTKRHHPLPQLCDVDLMRALTDGRDRLAELAGAPVDAIAYPHGMADERVAEVARRAGFRLGFTERGGANTASTNELLLDRIEASRASVGELAFDTVRALLKVQSL